MSMKSERVSDCRFTGRCKTFNSLLVPSHRKGPEGMGCLQQTDEYRRECCRHFACASLALTITEEHTLEPVS
jgi:hypothetical protein